MIADDYPLKLFKTYKQLIILWERNTATDWKKIALITETNL